ncbi:MAG: FHA domain-containing protein [Nitrosomonas sp.]|nr:FHA domain-containing protein [Nitrosomonas sp.]
MLNLFFAFAMVLGLIAVSYLSLTALGITKDITVMVSSSALALIPQLREYLEKREEFAKKGQSIAINSFDGFGLPMGRLLLYASLLMFAALQCTAAIGGFVHAMAGGATPETYSTEGLLRTLGVFIIFFAFPLIFLIGRWVGKTYISNGPITIVLAALFAQLSGKIVDILLLSEQEYSYIYTARDSHLLQVVGGTVMFSVIGLIGFWWGRKEKLLAYISYLLKQLSPEARISMVKALFEETKRISRTQIWPAQSSPIQQPDILNNPSQAVVQEHIAAVIVAIKGPLRGKQFAVKKGIFRIGSNSDNDLVIKGDPLVSRYHAYLRYGQDGLSLVDQKSTNGTHLNDHRLTDVPMAVNIGNRIRIGISIFEMLLPPS